MNKERIQEYKNDFKETEAYKWFTSLSDENKNKFKFRTIDNCAVVQGELIISFRGIKELYELYGR